MREDALKFDLEGCDGQRSERDTKKHEADSIRKQTNRGEGLYQGPLGNNSKIG